MSFQLKLGSLKIASPAFQPLARIPKRYTNDGENLSPQLEWSGANAGTKQFALICFDPDAPLPRGFTHWVVYGMPGETTGLPEGEGQKQRHAFVQGVNGTGKPGYMGPAPPSGHGPHHYFFWLYALDAALDLKPGMDKDQLIDAISDHVSSQARLVGIYEK